MLQPQQNRFYPNSVDFLVVSTTVEPPNVKQVLIKLEMFLKKGLKTTQKNIRRQYHKPAMFLPLGCFFGVWIKLGLVTRCHPQSFGLGRSATPRRRLKTDPVLKMKPAKPKPVRKETMKILIRRFDQKDSTLNQSVKVLKKTGHSQTQWKKQKAQRNHKFMVAKLALAGVFC